MYNHPDFFKERLEHDLDDLALRRYLGYLPAKWHLLWVAEVFLLIQTYCIWKFGKPLKHGDIIRKIIGNATSHMICWFWNRGIDMHWSTNIWQSIWQWGSTGSALASCRGVIETNNIAGLPWLPWLLGLCPISINITYMFIIIWKRDIIETMIGLW